MCNFSFQNLGWNNPSFPDHIENAQSHKNGWAFLLRLLEMIQIWVTIYILLIIWVWWWCSCTSVIEDLDALSEQERSVKAQMAALTTEETRLKYVCSSVLP
jgi:hypothetical protein